MSSAPRSFTLGKIAREVVERMSKSGDNPEFQPGWPSRTATGVISSDDTARALGAGLDGRFEPGAVVYVGDGQQFPSVEASGLLAPRPGAVVYVGDGQQFPSVEASGPLAPKPGTDEYGNRLPQDAKLRKELKVFEGCLDYFPDALAYVSLVSLEGAEKHCGGVLGWDRTKSTDHLNCAARHLLDVRGRDPESPRKLRHLGMLVWRLLAELQITLEKAKANGESWV